MNREKVARELLKLAKELTGGLHPVQARTTTLGGGKWITVAKIPVYITKEDISYFTGQIAQAEAKLKNEARALAKAMPSASANVPDKWGGPISSVKIEGPYIMQVQGGGIYIAINIEFKTGSQTSSSILTDTINTVMGWKYDR